MERLDAWLVTKAIWGLTRILCRVDGSQFHRIPAQGPLIIVSNHVNFLDVPVMFTHLLPRPITGFAKQETWDSPVMGYLFTIWGAIPIRRGEADISAIRQGLAALKAGKILAIAPEGTRSGTGVLGRGLPGVVTIALQSRAAILPVVYFGHEEYRNRFLKLQRVDFWVKVGAPFHLNPRNERITSELRQAMADEIMAQIAALLPPNYRGVYADFPIESPRHLVFLPG